MLGRALVVGLLAGVLALFSGCEDDSSPGTGDGGASDGGVGADAPTTSDAAPDSASTSGPGGPVPGGDCSTILCAADTKCVYVGEGALCGAPCTTRNETCGSGLACKCGGSCPMCKDCVLVCAP